MTSGMPRRGTLLLESVATLAILAIAVTTVAQIAIAQQRQRRALANLDMARQEAANAVEHVFAIPFEQLTEEHLQRIANRVTGELPNLVCSIRAVDDAESRGKQVDVMVTAQNEKTSFPQRVVRLTVWRFPASPPEEMTSREFTNNID
jgi:hypothetical protein